MSEKRFYVKKVTRDERPELFSSVGADYKYFIVERVKRSWGEYGGNLLFNFDVDYAFAEKVCNLLNEQQELIEEKSNAITLMGAFIKSKGFSIDDFDEWISKDWHNAKERGE